MKSTIRAFLDVSADVDYDAKLESRDGAPG